MIMNKKAIASPVIWTLVTLILAGIVALLLFTSLGEKLWAGITGIGDTATCSQHGYCGDRAYCELHDATNMGVYACTKSSDDWDNDGVKDKEDIDMDGDGICNNVSVKKKSSGEGYGDLEYVLALNGPSDSDYKAYMLKLGGKSYTGEFCGKDSNGDLDTDNDNDLCKDIAKANGGVITVNWSEEEKSAPKCDKVRTTQGNTCCIFKSGGFFG